MASTSKFIQLDAQILVEYIYTDQSSPDVIETDLNGARILLMDNEHTETKYLFTEDNPFITTGNFRGRSAAALDAERSRYGYLTLNSTINYLDFDDKLTSVNQLLDQLIGVPNVPTNPVEYDTIRLHLVSGFDFTERGDGFIFEVLVTGKDGKKHNLTSIAYLNSDSFDIINPRPFIVGEKLYTNFIEIKIPSYNYLVDEFLAAPSNDKGLAYNLSSGPGLQQDNGIGLLDNGVIDLELRFIVKTETVNGLREFIVGDEVSASINKLDEFSSLVAVIKESDNGDFFEVFGEFEGDIYEDFIIEQNNQPNTDIVVIHDLMVFEQVGTEFIQTSDQSFVQAGGFDQPYIFRPVILNSHIAVSYRIDYTLRIFNKADNSQIIRKSTFSSFDVKKYGRNLRKLNLGTVPVISDVFNILPDENQQINLQNSIQLTVEGGQEVLTRTEFVLGFRERLNISAAASAVQTTPAINQEGDVIPTDTSNAPDRDGVSQISDAPLEISSITPTNIFPQGEATISISPFDDFILFVLYDNSIQQATGTGEPQLLDLTSMGDLFISFFDEASGEEVRIKNFTNIKELSPAEGEVVFKIGKEQSKRILKFKDRKFYISSRLQIGADKSDETLIYTGTWLKPEEKVETRSSETISDLRQELTQVQENLTIEQQTNSETIEELEAQIVNLTKRNKALEDRLLTFTDDIPELLEDLRSDLQRQQNRKRKKKRARLSNQLKTGQAQISQATLSNIQGNTVRSIKINPGL